MPRRQSIFSHLTVQFELDVVLSGFVENDPSHILQMVIYDQRDNLAVKLILCVCVSKIENIHFMTYY